MKVELSNIEFFNKGEIDFDKRINFVFGKNGCGKSTITRLIKEQFNHDYDVRVFQGFESVVGDNNELQTVVLGQENIEIDNYIKEKENEIDKLNLEIVNIDNNILENGEFPDNLWGKRKNKEVICNNASREIDDFCKKSAKKIKDYELRISSSSYHINDFKSDIDKAKYLSDDEIKNLEILLRSEVKTASELFIQNIDLESELSFVNDILKSKVEERTYLVRLENNGEKRSFAEQGLKLHKVGDHCAFCNSIVSEETISELRTYFSADEVRAFKNKIEQKILQLTETSEEVKSLNIKTEDFYISYQDEVKEIKLRFDELKFGYINFIDVLISALHNKIASLFQESDLLELKEIENINVLVKEYNSIVKNNNISDLVKNKESAKNKLRLHLVCLYLEKFEYKTKIAKLELFKKELDDIDNEIKSEESKKQQLRSKISSFGIEIRNLQESTKNEKVLVERINKKLNLYASFNLVHQDGYNDYKVICSRTSNIRSVNELSTGEKNIIAFLYFIEKIHDFSDQREKCIIFDDPMNSNDDTVQYLIIEELQRLMNSKEAKKVVILTHNIHFYLNVKYGFKYNTDNFYHLLKVGLKVDIKKINDGKDDFKTNYSALWSELVFLLEKDDISPNMLLNPIRRIIETYTKFNGVSQEKFFSEIIGARKLFNVNSHSIDDLESELNGRTKQEIIDLLRECFQCNNALEHYNKFFGVTK